MKRFLSILCATLAIGLAAPVMAEDPPAAPAAVAADAAPAAVAAPEAAPAAAEAAPAAAPVDPMAAVGAAFAELAQAKPGDAQAGAGKAAACAACHGMDGKGNQALGAPNLTDAIWLYGGKKDQIVGSITKAHAGVMPAWGGKLDAVTIKMLATYVHSLGGGE